MAALKPIEAVHPQTSRARNTQSKSFRLSSTKAIRVNSHSQAAAAGINTGLFFRTASGSRRGILSRGS